MTTDLLINGAFGLLPVLAFLAILNGSDTFQLVRFRTIVERIAFGAAAALAASVVGKGVIEAGWVSASEFPRFWGPILEEALKASIIYILIRSHRIGFVLDAAISGFAIGAGFAVLENYFYLLVLGADQPALWVVRGFGTAIMHGGATAIFGVIVLALAPKEARIPYLTIACAFAAAGTIHVLFNQFLAFPVVSTIVMMTGLAATLSVVSQRGRKSIDRLVESDFDEYRKLLTAIRSGEFGADEVGRILQSLRIRFNPAEITEIFEYVGLQAELVLFAEKILIARRNGQSLEVPEKVKSDLAHFHYLDERIGRAVRLALRSRLKFSRYELFQLYKLQRDAGQIETKTHVFNSDLLFDENDRKAAARAFPDLLFALEHPELSSMFLSHDRRANQSKKRSRRTGAAALLLIVIALNISGALLLSESLSPLLARALGVAGVILGGAGVALAAFGVMHRSRKLRWLADRLATERLRQFHFQHYVANADLILAAAADQKLTEQYLEKRAASLRKFKKYFLDHIDENIHSIIHDEDCGDGALFGPEPISASPGNPHLERFFDAYARLRFDLQINYCNHVLRESRDLFRQSAARQAQLLTVVTFASVAILILFQGLVLLGAVVESGWMGAPLIHVLAFSAAIAALAARTCEEGLQPKREIERMRRYRVELRRVNARFREATTPQEKLAAMRDLEKVAYQEMTLFLKSSYEAQFVM